MNIYYKKIKMFLPVPSVIHLCFILIISYLIIIRGNYKIILADLNNPIYLTFLFFIIIFCIWGLYYNNNIRIKKATRQALIAFIIAYLAHSDMFFVAFFVVFIISFHLGDKAF